MTVILGIDPGSRITGYGVILKQQGRIQYLDSGCIKTHGEGLSEKLLQIFDGICELMETYAPHEISIEQVFMHQNPSSALKLGHARGVAMVAAASFRRPVFEYAARDVKQSIVGYGAASKEQVSHMVMRLLDLTKAPQVDASDALAIALCHAYKNTALMATQQKISPRRTHRRWTHDRLPKGTSD